MRIEVLNHGYVELIEAWGTGKAGVEQDSLGNVPVDFEVGIIEAARQSTDKAFEGWGPLKNCIHCGAHSTSTNLNTGNTCIKKEHDFTGDEKLLRYLHKHRHSTPFEAAGMVVEVQAPIMVYREWHRHRTQFYSEMSGRYVQLPKLCYIPSDERLRFGAQGTSNKQGSQESNFDDVFISDIQHVIEDNYEAAWKRYEGLLEAGVAKELARMVLPVSQYSRMRAGTSLRNWMHFLGLRMAPNAQWEIRQYANAVHRIMTATFPRTMELFDADFTRPERLKVLFKELRDAESQDAILEAIAKLEKELA